MQRKTKIKKNTKKKEISKNIRPEWNEYFFEVMDAIAKRATCDRGRSGCVIVKDNQILVTGYVGAEPGGRHCDEVGHRMVRVINPDGSESEHCTRTIHAETNAILQAAKLGVPLSGSTVYVSMTPCRNCAMAIIRVGIKEVHCRKKYHRGQESEKMFRKNRIKLTFESKEIQKYKRTS